MTDLPPPYDPRAGSGPGAASPPDGSEPSPWGQAPGPAGANRNEPIDVAPPLSAWGEAPNPSPWGPAPERGPGGWAPVPAPEPRTAAPRGPDRPSTATAALALSVAGLFCCGLLSVAAMFMARADLDAMNQGRTVDANRTRAEIAFALGIVGTVLTLAAVGFWAYIRFRVVR